MTLKAICLKPIGFDGVAEERWIAELSHEGLGKLVVGIGEYDRLNLLPEPVEKLCGAGQRIHGGYDLLNVPKLEPIFPQNRHTHAHELVVI